MLLAALAVSSRPVDALLFGASLAGVAAARAALGSRSRRVKAETDALEAMTLLSICLTAGLGLEESVIALDRVEPGGIWSGPARALALGRSFADSCTALPRDNESIRRLGAALTRAHSEGSAVADIVDRRRDDLAARLTEARAARAQRLGVWMMLPLTTCALPALAIVVVVPIAVNGLAGAAWQL